MTIKIKNEEHIEYSCKVLIIICLDTIISHFGVYVKKKDNNW